MEVRFRLHKQFDSYPHAIKASAVADFTISCEVCNRAYLENSVSRYNLTTVLLKCKYTYVYVDMAKIN